MGEGGQRERLRAPRPKEGHSRLLEPAGEGDDEASPDAESKAALVR